MRLQDYESLINRGALSYRSKRLDEVIKAINRYVRNGSLQGLVDIEQAVQTWQRQDPKEYADRGKPNENALANSIRQEAGKWGGGYGRIRLVDPSSNPKYAPHIWNDNVRTLLSTNCYAYACDDPYHHAYNDKPQPGMYMGIKNREMSNSAVRLAVMQDDQSRNALRKQRLIPLVRLRQEINNNSPIDVVNVPGYYLIALVVAKGRDYHWYRQDDTGYWSHKPGHTQATNLDASGKVITDPRDCNLGIYSFTTFYFAPKGGVRTASLGDWSNPDWHE
jgi:hypothetical protein